MDSTGCEGYWRTFFDDEIFVKITKNDSLRNLADLFIDVSTFSGRNCLLQRRACTRNCCRLSWGPLWGCTVAEDRLHVDDQGLLGVVGGPVNISFRNVKDKKDRRITIRWARRSKSVLGITAPGTDPAPTQNLCGLDFDSWKFPSLTWELSYVDWFMFED